MDHLSDLLTERDSEVNNALSFIQKFQNGELKFQNNFRTISSLHTTSNLNIQSSLMEFEKEEDFLGSEFEFSQKDELFQSDLSTSDVELHISK